MSSADWQALCEQAQAALAAGQRGSARRLAQAAARLAPEQALPWELLAALAGPGARRSYLRRAQQTQSAGLPAPSLRQPALRGLAVLAVLALTLATAAFAWTRPPSVDASLKSAGAALAGQLNGWLDVAEETAAPTLAATPTHTPFSQMSPLPTSTPTPLPPTAVPSPTPTEFPEIRVELAKYDLRLPSGIGPEERWIEVNLSTQTLVAYEGRNQVRSFVISSGRAGRETVTGEFRVWIKVRMQDMSGPGYYIRNVPWVMFFYEDYGIHGTWWHTNFGTPMSSGCVNMTEEDAKWLYDWASVGTLVQVHY